MKYNLPQHSQYSKEQQGFTLIELMISLVLGLLISAAVIQVFVTSQRVDRVQTAGSEIQDSAVFGLQAIEQQLRLANLGNDGVPLNDVTVTGGVVLTTNKDSNVAANLITKNNLNPGYLTRSEGLSNGGGIQNRWNKKLSNTTVNSDQLTIQYRNTTGKVMQDCEGEDIEVDARVITRYFVKEDSVATDKDRKNLNLNCDAGRINADGTFVGFPDAGQAIIINIDQFNVRLGVKQSVVTAGVTSYEYADMTVNDYMNITTTKPFITNIKLAVLTRSGANSPEATEGPFNIFGTNQTLKTQADAPKYLRRVYATNTLLRNARIVNVIRTQPTVPVS